MSSVSSIPDNQDRRFWNCEDTAVLLIAWTGHQQDEANLLQVVMIAKYCCGIL